jgi:hypothetical protein
MNRRRTIPTFPVLLALGLYLALFVPVRGLPGCSSVGAAESPPETVVFEMTYRALNKPDDPLSYRAYWGFGGIDGANDPFVQAVKRRVKDCTVVYNRALPKAQWSVVELQDQRPIALYFDVNADGELSEQEKFLPAVPSGSNFGYPYAFVTSDFLIRKDQREIPFRVMLVGNTYGDSRVSYMWSPAGVLEGQANLAGEPMRLVLYANGFSGSFTDFGSCSFMLLPAGQKLEGYLPRSPLSSLIQHERTFYRLKLSGTHEKDKTVRITFEKDTTPTGHLAAALRGKETLKARIASATIQGATDNSIQFQVADLALPLPEGRYRLGYAAVSYGAERDDEWRIMFNEGPTFEINAGKTRQVALGGLTLSVSAVDEKDRYNSNAREQSTYVKGTTIYLTPRIKGKVGEVYTRFSQKNATGNNFTDVKPHLTILDPDGKTVASADMEYG